MKFDLPPLTGLPAFEAAARYKSFTKAAGELCVTQAAISFQVRNLEAALNVKLFVRHHRALELTPKGRSLLAAVQLAFSTLADEKALITGVTPMDTVSITAPISLSGKWLVPRLHRLYGTVPGSSLRIDANDTVLDLEGQNVQLAIRYCAAPPAELKAVKLLEDIIFPVCSPQIIQALGRDMKLKDLNDVTLLSDQMTDFTWQDWFEIASLTPDTAGAGIGFSHTANAIDAAIAGQGIALGRLPLVADDLESGRLVRPFASTGQSGHAYYLIRAVKLPSNQRVDAVADWLVAEANATENTLETGEDTQV